jgi:hypothetical protein
MLYYVTGHPVFKLAPITCVTAHPTLNLVITSFPFPPYHSLLFAKFDSLGHSVNNSNSIMALGLGFRGF